MPTYDYKCDNCGITFEYFQSMKDNALETCNECGGSLKRLIGAGAGPIFKGSGFYQTDYKNNGKGKSSSNSDKKSSSKNQTKKPAK